MKRITIPLSLAVVAGMAQAQSSVTLYGTVGGGLRWADNMKGGSAVQYSSIETPNRFGFQGAEDLGGSVKAIFVLENSFSTGTGAMAKTGILFDHAAYVGMTSNYGRLTLGRQLTASEDLTIALDPDAVGGGTSAIAPDALLAANFFTLDTRFNNTVKYTNTVGGVKVNVSYTFGGVAGNTRASSDYAGAVSYYNGIVMGGASYQRVYDPDATQMAQTYQVGGSWQLGPLRLYLSYLALMVSGSATNPAQRRDSVPQGGIVYQVTPAFVVTAAFYDDIANNLGDKRGANGHKTTAYVIADYFLSKRTNVYFEVDRNSFTGAYQTDPTNLAAFNRNPTSAAALGVTVGLTTRF